jgi:putative peptidoglycan lipid II flippase
VKRGEFVVDAQLRRRAPRLAMAAVLMGAAMWFLNALFQPFVLGTSVERWGALVLLVGTGGLVYAAATVLTGAVRVADLKRLVRRS